MKEIEILVINKLMSFGVLPDINNLPKVKELIELVNKAESEQLFLSGVSKWQWIANTTPELENKIYNVLDKHGKEGKLIFGCSGFMNEPYSFFDSEFIKGSDVIAFC
ncbi:MAG: hypothetical protein ACJAVA_000253 [Flavobacteriaceae bacterium]|jgi:hypothetical protein